jgi:diaminohydroxyphosphoribosylaminopyrimidine deaminase/5-amino-6-(5-phosphoribosylamino)uracil reductase
VRVLLPGAHDVLRVEELRARASVVLTGCGTVLADDPRLDVRLPGAWRQPLRVVLDARLCTPPGARLLAAPGQALVLTANADPARRAALEAAGARVERVAAAAVGLDLSAALEHLAGLGVNEALVEAGARLTRAFCDAGLADEMIGAPEAGGEAGWPL